MIVAERDKTKYILEITAYKSSPVKEREMVKMQEACGDGNEATKTLSDQTKLWW